MRSTLAVAFLALALPAYAQRDRNAATNAGDQVVGQYEIRGRLVFPTPRPPEDRIEVFLERNMQRIQSAFTDSLGQFEFRAVSALDYQIVVRFPDYEDINQLITVYPTQRTTTITIQMNPLFAIVRKRAPGFEGDDPDVVDVNLMMKSYPKKAVQEYEKALDENKKGATDKAILHFQEALKIAPDFYHAHNNIGIAFAKVQRYSEAEKAYKRARELNPRA